MIDVGGIALLSAAARNYAAVAAVSSPRHYARLIEELRETRASCPPSFASAWPPTPSPTSPPTTPRSPATSTTSPARASRSALPLVAREGARPGLRREPAPAGGLLPRDDAPHGLAGRRHQLQGDPPTFNDLLDLDAAYRIATDFTAPTCCIVKQANPAGLASNDRLRRRLPEGARGRPGHRIRRRRRRQPRGRRETAEADRRQRLRGRRGAGLLRRRRAACSAEKEQLTLLAVPAAPLDGLTDYGIARPRLPPHRRRPAGRDARPLGARPLAAAAS